jgi:hypothetical protein
MCVCMYCYEVNIRIRIALTLIIMIIPNTADWCKLNLLRPSAKVGYVCGRLDTFALANLAHPIPDDARIEAQ